MVHPIALASEGALFRWVAMLTGSKNALKGVGFLLGEVLLQTLGFQGGLWLMAGGLAVFAPLFAINSALHSYLIVAYSDADKVALNVGFYYMANAIGRLGGTMLSGLVYQLAGLTACLWVFAAFLVIAAAVALALPTTGAAQRRAVQA